MANLSANNNVPDQTPRFDMGLHWLPITCVCVCGGGGGVGGWGLAGGGGSLYTKMINRYWIHQIWC